MKKLIALVLAAIMMMTVVSVFAATDSDLDKDTTVSITGLDDGDTVNLYKVVKWVDGEGWKIEDKFADLVDESNTELYSANVAAIVNPKTTGDISLTKADVEKITKIAKRSTVSAKYTGTVSGETYTEDPAELGMYLALIEPFKADTIYNPMIVSADYTPGLTNTIDSSESLVQDTVSVAKKDTVTVEKEVDDLTLDAGEPVKFTITTTIPAFADSYVNPYFNLTDTLQLGINMVVDAEHPFTVEPTTMTFPAADIPADNATTFTLHFDSAKIAALVAPQEVTVTYYAKITDTSLYSVSEETNDVEVKFSNNPHDDNGHGHQKDEVKVYTFTIDGKLFGRDDYRNSELVKVGVDKNGNAVESEILLDNNSKHAALNDAVFGVYTDKAEADAASANYYTNSVFGGTVTTADGGLMEIKGLDEGTYYLKELSAPAGYIKDPTTHKIEIKAFTKKVTKTEELDDHCEVTYEVEVLDKYTVTIDGAATSTYNMTLDGPSISTVTPADSSSEIKNTKGLELPSTGGIGTTLFYAIGGIMVLAAGIVLVTRRKADEE